MKHEREKEVLRIIIREVLMTGHRIIRGDFFQRKRLAEQKLEDFNCSSYMKTEADNEGGLLIFF